MKLKNYLLISMLLVIISISLVSAFEFDNVKEYNPITREVTIINAYGFGDVIGKARLNTPFNLKVLPGKDRLVAEFDIWAYQDYSDALKEVKFYDKGAENWKENQLSKSFVYKYKIEKQVLVDDYYIYCIPDLIGINDCFKNITGSHYETVTAWEEINPADLKKNQKITVGVFTDVTPGDYVEWIPLIYGVEIDEWASYLGYNEYSLHNLTSNTGGNIKTWASSEAAGPAYKAFDGNLVYPNTWVSSTIPAWHKTDFGSDFILKYLIIYSSATGSTDYKNWLLYGSNDNSTWSLMTSGLHTQAAGNYTINLSSNTDSYRFYRLNATDNYGAAGVRFGEEMYFYGEENSTDSPPTITLNSPTSANYTTSPQIAVINLTAYDDLNLTDVKLYINDVLNETNASGLNNTDYIFNLTLTDGDYTIYGKATDNESQSTNSQSIRIVIDSIAPTINITSPVTDNITTTLPINLTLISNSSDVHLSTCWYYTSDNATNITYTCNTSQTLNFVTGGNKTVYLFVNDTFGNENLTSSSFLINYIQESANYDASVIETENYTVQLNITASYISSINGTLIYNGVEYNTTVTIANGTALLTTNLTAPSTDENIIVNFNWTYNLNGIDYNSSNYQHIIFELTPLFFATNCDDKALKFVLKDEENGTAITGDMEFNFLYGTINSTSEEVYGSLTGVSTFYGCINATVSPNYTIGYGEIQYRTADHVDRRYYIFEGSVITNDTTNITLYDLLSDDQTSFKLEVEDTSLNPYTNKYTALVRWYPDLDEYNIVDMGKTDETGSTVIHVRTEDVDYRIGVYEPNGTLIKLADPIRMVCLVSPCTYTLKVAPGETDYTSFLNIDYSLSYNQSTGIWSFVFSDSTQETSEINLTIYKQTGSSVYPICSNTIAASSGAVTCNTSIYSGTLRAVVTRSASPPVVLAEKIIQTTTTAFSSTFGLWLSILIGIPIIFIFAFMSPLGAVIGGVIALLPALYLQAITLTVFGGVLIIAGIVMHFLKRIG